ncbi:MAG TPA: DUF4395 family protein [Candidatus Dormibacteraeota bacterium]
MSVQQHEERPPHPVDRTAARIQRGLVMVVLGVGWALARSHPGFDLVLPAVGAVLLAASAYPVLSLPRLISGRLLPALHLPGPSLGSEDPAPHRLGDAAIGLLLVPASLLAAVGVEPGAWAIGWVVIAVALVEFTFDVSLVALLA